MLLRKRDPAGCSCILKALSSNILFQDLLWFGVRGILILTRDVSVNPMNKTCCYSMHVEVTKTPLESTLQMLVAFQGYAIDARL